LKLGHYIHKNIVPTIENKSDSLVVDKFFSYFSSLSLPGDVIIATAKPNYAPNVWIYIDPPISIAPNKL